MGQADYARRFHAAVTKAFAASDSNVRLAYIDLASFYHGKLRERASMYPTADLLRGVAREGCRKKQCWCR